MSNMEDFIKNNREDFDKFEPGPVVWHNIQQQMKKPAERKGILISMTAIRWSAAAAVMILLGTGVYYFISRNTSPETNLAGTKEKPSNHLPVVAPHDTTRDTPATQEMTKPGNKEELAGNNEENEELAHYARLIEIKQDQIMKIKKDEPLLYQQFAGDFNKLDSTFHILKKQLPVNPNREQILEAMIQNLQYQEALLNQQLNIIKKINNTKKEAYEKAYKSA
jgi:hypothetical protein